MRRSVINLKHHTDTFIKQPKFSKRKKISIFKTLDHKTIAVILNYLRLAEILHLYTAVDKNKKYAQTKSSIINYLILSYRFYSKWEEQEFVEVLVDAGKETKKRRSDNDSRISTQSCNYNSISLKLMNSTNQKSRINRCQQNIKYDVERTYIKTNFSENIRPKAINRSVTREGQIYYEKPTPKGFRLQTKINIQNMQDYLNRVLLNISKKYPKVGYIQGLNYIVKTMFLTGLSEEHAYDYLCFFLQKKKFAKILVNGMIGLRELAYALKVYTFNYVPSVFNHFQKYDVDTQVFATSWFITLFSEDLPLFITNKLWHLFALEGWKILIQFSLAVLCAFQNQILAQNGDEIFSYLRKIMITFQEPTNKSVALEATVWKLMASIDVSNKMVDQLCQQMEIMQYDCEIELWKIQNLSKKWKNTSRTMSEKSLILEHRSMSPILTTRVCCDRISPSPSVFPFCQNIGSKCE